MKKYFLLFGLLLISYHLSAQNMKSILDDAVRFAETQTVNSIKSFGDSIPYLRAGLMDGTWKYEKANGWTSGFYPGVLWYMHELTKKEIFKKAAVRWTEGLTDQQFMTRNHDIGFMMYCSFGNAIRLYPNEEYNKILMQSAKSLETRFSPTVGCTRSWDNRRWPFPVIIDNMMNLELLFWAAKNGGDKKFYDIAVSHAKKTAENHFREDGSTYHVVSYDSTNGKVLARETHQGFAHESVWARGQAWALYGFTMAYRETKDKLFLETAQRAADYFVNNLPEDFVPYWDYKAPNIPAEERDASAGAIAASALFELSTFTKEEMLRKKYRDFAEKILRSLAVSYLAKGTQSPAILLHSVGSKPAKSEIDVSLIYADYYFLEAILRYKNMK